MEKYRIKRHCDGCNKASENKSNSLITGHVCYIFTSQKNQLLHAVPGQVQNTSPTSKMTHYYFATYKINKIIHNGIIKGIYQSYTVNYQYAIIISFK